MKICSPQLGLDPHSNLGGEVHDHNILSQFALTGNKVYVYLPKGRHFEKNKNIIVLRAPIKHFPAFLFNIMTIPFIFKMYKQNKFDILRVHSPYFVGISAIIFKLFHPSVPVVATFHLVEKGTAFDIINRLTVSKYDAVICVNEHVRSWLIKRYGLNPKKAHTVANGVSKDFKPYAIKNKSIVKKLDLKNKILLLFVGLLTKRKKPDILLKVFREIKRNNQNVALIICGVGPLKKSLVNYINKYSLKDIYFAGVVRDKAKLDYYNASDIFVMPSQDEGMPLSLLEAMSFAKAVIVSKSPYTQGLIINGVDGFQVESDDIASWCSTINTVIKNDVLRKRVGNAARKKIKNGFQWESAAISQLKVFKDLTK